MINEPRKFVDLSWFKRGWCALRSDHMLNIRLAHDERTLMIDESMMGRQTRYWRKWTFLDKCRLTEAHDGSSERVCR